MIRKKINLLLILVTVSCISEKTIRYKTYNNGKKITYLMNIPRGYIQKTQRDDHGRVKYDFIYSDSSSIYMTDNEESGAVFFAKSHKYGDSIYLKVQTSDTLELTGEHEGRYWREIKLGRIVVGYMNVYNDKKQTFDDILSTLRKK